MSVCYYAKTEVYIGPRSYRFSIIIPRTEESNIVDIAREARKLILTEVERDSTRRIARITSKDRTLIPVPNTFVLPADYEWLWCEEQVYSDRIVFAFRKRNIGLLSQRAWAESAVRRHMRVPVAALEVVSRGVKQAYRNMINKF